VGLSPIDGDTAQFYFADTNVGTVLQYNGTAWQNVTGQVIDGNLIVTGTISANQIAANAITAGKIQASAITTDKLDANSITADKIAANAVVANSISANAVTADKIQANAVTAVKIATDSVTADKIQANAVTAVKIAASTITGDKIAASTITGNLISANTIAGTNIIASTITGNNIAANTITGNLISANTITGNNIAANTIAATQIVANSITTTQISTSYIYAGNIESVGATLGNVSSPGYWLRYTDGSARFGGNVSIGNNLTVGNLITASSLNANVVTLDNIVPGVLPNAGSTVFNPGSVSMNTTAGTWDGIYSGSVYYKQLAYQRITTSPAWATISPTLRIVASCLITATGYTSSGGYPAVFIYYNTPAQGGNNTAPVITGGSGTPPSGSINIRTDATIFSSPAPNFSGTFAYAVTLIPGAGSGIWGTAFPTTFGFSLLNTLNGTWNISQIQFTVNYG
jgi:hypothetical protein